MNLRMPSDPILAAQALRTWPEIDETFRGAERPMDLPPGADLRVGPWTSDEERRLRRFWAGGVSLTDAAFIFCRSKSDVSRKAFSGLKIRRPKRKRA